jgi:hypothetical protein
MDENLLVGLIGAGAAFGGAFLGGIIPVIGTYSENKKQRALTAYSEWITLVQRSTNVSQAYLVRCHAGAIGAVEFNGRLRQLSKLFDLDHWSLLHTGKLVGNLRHDRRYPQQRLRSNRERHPTRLRRHRAHLLQRIRRPMRDECRLLPWDALSDRRGKSNLHLDRGDR